MVIQQIAPRISTKASAIGLSFIANLAVPVDGFHFLQPFLCFIINL
jgi:hypothetical protein